MYDNKDAEIAVESINAAQTEYEVRSLCQTIKIVKIFARPDDIYYLWDNINKLESLTAIHEQSKLNLATVFSPYEATLKKFIDRLYKHNFESEKIQLFLKLFYEDLENWKPIETEPNRIFHLISLLQRNEVIEIFLKIAISDLISLFNNSKIKFSFDNINAISDEVWLIIAEKIADEIVRNRKIPYFVEGDGDIFPKYNKILTKLPIEKYPFILEKYAKYYKDLFREDNLTIFNGLKPEQFFSAINSLKRVLQLIRSNLTETLQELINKNFTTAADKEKIYRGFFNIPDAEEFGREVVKFKIVYKELRDSKIFPELRTDFVEDNLLLNDKDFWDKAIKHAAQEPQSRTATVLCSLVGSADNYQITQARAIDKIWTVRRLAYMIYTISEEEYKNNHEAQKKVDDFLKTKEVLIEVLSKLDVNKFCMMIRLHRTAISQISDHTFVLKELIAHKFYPTQNQNKDLETVYKELIGNPSSFKANYKWLHQQLWFPSLHTNFLNNLKGLEEQKKFETIVKHACEKMDSRTVDAACTLSNYKP